jgi:hypothetical protein
MDCIVQPTLTVLICNSAVFTDDFLWSVHLTAIKVSFLARGIVPITHQVLISESKDLILDLIAIVLRNLVAHHRSLTPRHIEMLRFLRLSQCTRFDQAQVL